MNQVNWKRVLLVYLIGGIVLVALWFGFRSILQSPAEAAGQAASQLLVDNPSHHFGRVAAGTVLAHEFELTNKGSVRIVLNRKFCGSCGDEIVNPTTILAAGESTQIPVVITTDNQTGDFNQTVTLTTSDPRQPRIELTLSAEIVHP